MKIKDIETRRITGVSSYAAVLGIITVAQEFSSLSELYNQQFRMQIYEHCVSWMVFENLLIRLYN